MKILILNRHFVAGGIERVLISYLEIFNKLNYDVTVLSLYDSSQIYKGFYYLLSPLTRYINLKYCLNNKESEKFLTLKSKKNLKNKFIYKIIKPYFKRKIKNSIKNELHIQYDIIIDFSNILDAKLFRFKNGNTPIIRWIHSQLECDKNKKCY